MRRITRLAGTAAAAGLAASLLSAAPAAPVWADASVQSQLAQVRAATADFHSIPAANDAGYSPFLDCFDDPSGGMGQHFLDASLLDDTADLLHPEVLVYEPRPDGYKLVAVEYVVPGPEDMTPPVLLDQHFTYLPDLGVWKLHAWIWRPNPDGMFKDYNPNVRRCP